jgi:hypothetical protein
MHRSTLLLLASHLLLPLTLKNLCRRWSAGCAGGRLLRRGRPEGNIGAVAGATVPVPATPLLMGEGAIASAAVKGPAEESSRTRAARASGWLREQRLSLPIVTGPCMERRRGSGGGMGEEAIRHGERVEQPNLCPVPPVGAGFFSTGRQDGNGPRYPVPDRDFLHQGMRTGRFWSARGASRAKRLPRRVQRG